MRNRMHITAAHVAEICEAKNAAYGDSVARSAEALRLLYPDGLHPDQYLDAIFAARDFDKRSRLAQLTVEMAARTDEGLREDIFAMIEDALLDMAGYALLRLHQYHTEHERKAPAPCPTESASAPAAESPQQGTAGFAAAPASGSTTTTASRSSATAGARPSPTPSTSASASEAASAPTAMEAASPNGSASPAPPSVFNPAGDPRVNTILMGSACGRNRAGRCARCNGKLDAKHDFHLHIFGIDLRFDDRYCLTLFEKETQAA